MFWELVVVFKDAFPVATCPIYTDWELLLFNTVLVKRTEFEDIDGLPAIMADPAAPDNTPLVPLNVINSYFVLLVVPDKRPVGPVCPIEPACPVGPVCPV